MTLKYVTGPITKADAGGFEAIISTPKVDKDGESVDPMGLRNRDEWLTNPLIFWAHEWAYDPSAEPVGKGTKLDVFRDRIESAGVFAPTPKAQNVRALVQGGFIRKGSIGFDPITMATIKGIPTHTVWDLREWSFVPMPANTDATITGVKSALRWFADQIAEPESEVRIDWGVKEFESDVTVTAADVERIVTATVADHLSLITDRISPNVVHLRDGNRIIASIQRRRVATFPQSS